MASNPTRKTEVQAYSFEVRRMNSALVRRDPVMLHDPLRTHTRATIVGVILAMVGLLGFLIFGILKPNAKAPDTGIVIGKESLQVYVKTENPEMLIPTFNLASARLILMGRQQNAQGAQGNEQVEVVQPQVIPDARLADIPRGRWQGIPGAPRLPGAEDVIPDNWAVCHHIDIDENKNPDVALELARENAAELQQTAVLAGVPKLGDPLQSSVSLLAEVGKKRYLIYRPEENPNRTSDIVRAEVPDIPSVNIALNLNDAKPRPMTLALLEAIEEVPPLEPPEIGGQGTATDFNLGDHKATVGEVFGIELPGGRQEFYVMLKDGYQKITQAVATMIVFEETNSTTIPKIEADLLQGMKETDKPLPVDDYPAQVSTVLDPTKYKTACLGWSIQDGKGRTSMFYGNEIPLPKDENGVPKFATKIGRANEQGILIDMFYMPAGKSAVVNAVTSTDSGNFGPIQIISDSGVRFGIPSNDTAQGLGLPKRRPGPESIIKLLPAGGTLSVQEANRSFDSLPLEPEAGDFEGQNPGAAVQPGG